MKQRNLRLLSILLFMCILAIPAHYTHINAATITLANGQKPASILYANHSYTLKVKGARVYFYSNNNRIISVNKQTGKLTVKEPGSVTISAKSRLSGATLCKKTFIVRRRTDYLYTDNKTIQMVTGETERVSVKKSPLTSTDIIRYQSSNTAVIKVNSLTGYVTAVGPGTAYVTAYSKADAKISNKSASNKRIRIKIKVYSSIVSAKQVGLDQVEVTFSGTPATLTDRDFTLINVNNETLSVVAVSVTDKTALLTLSKKITDSKVYSVVYKSSSCNFTATDGKIAKFELSQTKVPINVETPVVAYSYDKYGIQIGEYTYGTTYPNITFTVSSSYLTQDKRLKFPTSKGTALARITYNETTNGITKTLVDSGSISITSYDPELLSAQYRCHITRDTNFTFTKDTQCNLSLSLNSGTYYAYFNIITSKGNEVGDYQQYFVESTDKNVLITSSTVIDNTQKCIPLYALKTGTSYLMIKDINGSILYSFPVVVRPASTLTNITVSNNSLYMPNDQNDLTTEVTINAVDQYGSTMNDQIPYGYTVECTSTTARYVTVSEVNSNSFAYFNLTYPKLTFLSYQLQPGTYTYKITLDKKVCYVTVVIVGNEVRNY